ncbi:MAG: hypothetical protein WB676_12070 [Bryobacteraceae bacterium]
MTKTELNAFRRALEHSRTELENGSWNREALAIETSPDELDRIQKGAEHHKKAAGHHELAAKHHREAAKHHEAGSHEKAAHHSEIAAGHGLNATYHTEEATKHHADEHTGKGAAA